MQAAIGDAYMHALTLCNLAEAHRYLGDLDQSLRLARAGLEEFQQQKSAFGQALAHLNLGEALLEQGEPQNARAEHLEIARRLLEQNDITDTLCEVLVVIAECHLAEGALADAEAVVSHTLEVADANECAGDRANALRCPRACSVSGKGGITRRRKFCVRAKRSSGHRDNPTIWDGPAWRRRSYTRQIRPERLRPGQP